MSGDDTVATAVHVIPLLWQNPGPRGEEYRARTHRQLARDLAHMLTAAGYEQVGDPVTVTHVRHRLGAAWCAPEDVPTRDVAALRLTMSCRCRPISEGARDA